MTADLFAESSPAAVHDAPRLTAWVPAQWPVHADWQPTLDAFWRSAQGVSLAAFVQSRLDAGAVIYPQHPLWALQLTPLSQVKVVILGQDPYHGPGQAHGLWQHNIQHALKPIQASRASGFGLSFGH